MKGRRSFLLSAVALAVGAASPVSAFAQQKLRIAFANYNDEASFGTLVLRGVQAAAKARPDVEVLYYDNRQDAARTVENARNIITVRPDVFIEYTSLVVANVQVGRLMKEAGIPVLSVQTRVPDTPIFAVDNVLSGYAAGKAVAEAAQKKWPGVTPAILIIGLPEAGPLFLERAAAARKGLTEVFPNAVIDEQSSKNDPNTARQITTDFLTKNGGKKVIVWAHVDGMGIAALTAARNSGREADFLISSTGGEAAILPEIRKPGGPYVGTFSFFPETWGADLLNLAVKLAKKEPLPDTTRPSKQIFITSENIDQHFPR